MFFFLSFLFNSKSNYSASSLDYYVLFSRCTRKMKPRRARSRYEHERYTNIINKRNLKHGMGKMQKGISNNNNPKNVRDDSSASSHTQTHLRKNAMQSLYGWRIELKLKPPNEASDAVAMNIIVMSYSWFSSSQRHSAFAVEKCKWSIHFNPSNEAHGHSNSQLSHIHNNKSIDALPQPWAAFICRILRHPQVWL